VGRWGISGVLTLEMGKGGRAGSFSIGKFCPMGRKKKTREIAHYLGFFLYWGGRGGDHPESQGHKPPKLTKMKTGPG